MQEEIFYMLKDGREATLQENGKLLVKGASPKSADAWLNADTAGAKPMQILRYLEADAGSYFYKNDTCIASNVLIERFVLEGHTLTVDLSKGSRIFKAIADNVEFSMNGNDPQFTAKQMKAIVFMPEKMK